MLKRKRNQIAITIAVLTFLTAFGIALAATVQVSREVPSTLSVVDVEVIADNNLFLSHDPEGNEPVDSLEILLLRLQPPLEPRLLENVIYIRNDSDTELTLIAPCDEIVDDNDDVIIHNIHFNLNEIGGEWFGNTCGGGSPVLSPGETARAQMWIDVESDIASGDYSFSLVFGAIGDGEPDVPIEPPDGMVSWWPGDGNADDIIDGNDGTLMNGASFAQGKVDEGFEFDGDDDFVEVADADNLNITGDVTVDLWAKRSGGVILISKGNNVGGDGPLAYSLYFSSSDIETGRISADLETDEGVDAELIGPVVNDTEFHHYAYVREGNVHRLFLDGEVVAEDTFDITPGDTSGIPLHIGAFEGDSGFDFHFEGIIDEIEIFDRALGNDEIRSIFEAGSAGKIKPLSQIAFGSNRDGSFKIYLMDADGSNQTKLTNDETGHDFWPDWSPDGTQIAFYSLIDENNREIYVIDSDGSNLDQLTDSPSRDETPVWSPDGSNIAFSTDRDGDWEVYVMNSDGSDPVNLSNNPNSVDVRPTWSPDGNKIAFDSDLDGDKEVYVMNANGSEQINITDNDDHDFGAAWSSDGNEIAFMSERDGNTELYVMDVNGSDQTRLTTNTVEDRWPDWSPDGKRIVFDSATGGDREIVSIRADGSGLTPLTNNNDDDLDPKWSPVIVP